MGAIAGVTQFFYIYIYICMHKWYYIITLTFIQENFLPCNVFGVFAWRHGPDRGARNGSLYTCICFGRQRGNFVKSTYRKFVLLPTQKDVVLCISARFRPVCNFLPINAMRHKTPLEQHMCDICHFNAIYVPQLVVYMVYAVTYMAVTSDRCTAFGDVMSQFTEFAKEAFGRLTILSVTFTTHSLLM